MRWVTWMDGVRNLCSVIVYNLFGCLIRRISVSPKDSIKWLLEASLDQLICTSWGICTFCMHMQLYPSPLLPSLLVFLTNECKIFCDNQVVDACSKYNSQCEDMDVEQAKSPDLSVRSGGHCRVKDARQSLEHQGNQNISSESLCLPTSGVSGIQKITPSYNDVSMFRGICFHQIFWSFKVDLEGCLPFLFWIMLKED